MNSKSIPWRVEKWLWLAVLGGLFFGVYGMCNRITSLLSDVGEFYFAWERQIPFVPVMIIPYMSIDLLFAGAVFLCREREELHTLATRIILAIGLSATGFLLFPLRMGFARPEVNGVLGAIFAPLNAMDLPFNLAPSLHISLRTIIWMIYAKRLKGWARYAAGFWFVLIGASTLLVYQHHLFDVVAGEIVALICLYLLPEQRPSVVASVSNSADITAGKNCKLARLYALLGIVLLGVASIPVTGAWPLVWPAVALLIVAAGYWKWGGSIFRKQVGVLPLSTKVLLAPFLIGSDLSHHWLARKHAPWAAITSRVLVGKRLNTQEAQMLLNEGVTAVLDVTAEYDETASLTAISYLNIPLLDHTAPSQAQIEQGVAFIREHAENGKVYVHCALGYSRSVAMVAAYLLAEGVCTTAEDAAKLVQSLRTCARITPRLTNALAQFQLSQGETVSSLSCEAEC